MNEKELLAMLEQAAASAEKSLNLGYNRLTDAGAVALAQSPHMAGLQRLGLWCNGITDAGAIALAQSPHLAALQSLDLYDNDITDAGAMALAQSPHMAALQHLDIRYNRLTDAGAMALAQSPHLAGLQRLYLWGKPLADAVIDLLRLRESFLSIQGPALADAVSADPANLFLLARLFLEQGGVSEGPLFAAIAATPQDSLFWGWLEAKAEQVEDAAVPQALSFFPANATLQQRASFFRRRDVAFEEALF